MKLNQVPKLIPNLFNKERYVLHYKNLKLYHQLGMEVINIHQVLGFTQSAWMKPYVDLNVENRKHATSTFDQDLYKIMINSVFGKSIENIRKRTNVKLVTCPHKMIKLASKPSFESFRIFSDNRAAAHMKQCNIKLNKPIYLGMCMLDISKHHMFDFHYNTMKPAFEKTKMLYTDTDSNRN